MKGVYCHHELFLKTVEMGDEYDAELFSNRFREPRKFLTHVVDKATEHGYQAAGFVMQPWQIDKAELVSLLGDESVKKVVLVRSNRFEMFMSDTKAHIAHAWQETNSAEASFLSAYKATAGHRMNVSAEAYVEFTSAAATWYDFVIEELLRTNSEAHFVSYSTFLLGDNFLRLHAHLLHQFLELPGAVDFNPSLLQDGKRETGCPGRNVDNLHEFAETLREEYPDLQSAITCFA